MRDSLYDDTAVRLALIPVVRSANGTVTGPSVDMAGNRNYFRSAMLVVVAGDVTDGTHTVSLEHSDTGSSGWAPVPAEHRQGSFPVLTSTSDNTTHKVAYSGAKRYVRAVITTTAAPATPVGGVVGAVLLLSEGSGRPV